MPAKLLEGKILAKDIQEKIAARVAQLKQNGKAAPQLRVLEVGIDPGSAWYVAQQEKLAARLGILFEKIPSSQIHNQKELLNQIQKANQDENVHGIFLSMPFPAGFEIDSALASLIFEKDVEGVHPASLGQMILRKPCLIPPTAYASVRLLEYAESDLKGKKAVVIGQSAIVGRPVALLLGERKMTVTICNTGTTPQDLEQFVKTSDVVVACAGKPDLVKGAWIKSGAIVIDVGTTEVAGKLKGDVEFASASEEASWITPVPGGVGPLTVTMLMQNLMDAYEWQQKRKL